MSAQQAVVEIVRDAKNKAMVNLFGATLLSWIHDETEMIFVSKGSTFDNKKAIRGGIPIVFPNFGPWDLGRPNHGFARINMWHCTTTPQKDSNGDAAAVFTLTDSEETRKMWQDNRFELNYTVTVKADGLNTQLTIKNLNGSASFDFTCLFHTYFNVPDVSKITISGLGGLTYKDKTDGFKEKIENDEPKSINSYTDSVYASALRDHLITNVAGDKTVCLKKTNFPDTVIWNPWAERAKSVELVENEYTHMICVEAGYVSKLHTIQPVLSADEKKRAAQYLDGLKTVGLTAVIWDSINQVGLDDVHDHIGIQFDEDDAGYSRVVFWDAEGPSLQMPKKVFLEILLFASNVIFKDIAERTGSTDEVERLARAIAHLKHEVDSCPGETVEVYRKFLDDGYVPNSVQQSVEEVRVHRETITSANSDVEVENWSSIHARRRRSTMGIEGVVERLPELRKRYEHETNLITRIRNKLKAILMFRSNTHHHAVPQVERDITPTKLEIINEEEI